jgi:hypothetical protein
MDSEEDGRWLTYAELGSTHGISNESALNRPGQGGNWRSCGKRLRNGVSVAWGGGCCRRGGVRRLKGLDSAGQTAPV